MIIGSHAILYSKDPEKDRSFLRDVLALSHVDVGGGWLIFGLPPSEVAIHPSDGDTGHELYLMCNDVEAFVSSMSQNGMECSEVEDQGWGLLTRVTLPGGSKLGVYEPRHARPDPSAAFGEAKVKRDASRKTSRAATAKPAAPARKRAVAKKASKPGTAKVAKKKVAKKKARKRRS